MFLKQSVSLCCRDEGLFLFFCLRTAKSLFAADIRDFFFFRQQRVSGVSRAPFSVVYTVPYTFFFSGQRSCSRPWCTLYSIIYTKSPCKMTKRGLGAGQLRNLIPQLNSATFTFFQTSHNPASSARTYSIGKRGLLILSTAPSPAIVVKETYGIGKRGLLYR